MSKRKRALKSCVALLSGGMDSSVMVAWAHELEWEVHGLTILYGSKHNQREARSAKWIGKKYCKSHKILRLDGLGKLLQSDLIKGSTKIPKGAGSIVPMRNAIMLSIASGYAISKGVKYIYLATHYGDHEVYPDCRTIFNRSIKDALWEGSEGKVILSFPFQYESREYIINLGEKLGVDFNKTWSCYMGGEKPCGKCGACIERKKVFKLVKKEDPLCC